MNIYIFIWLFIEKAMVPHSSTLAWKIPWMEEPGGLLSLGSPRVRHDWSDLAAWLFWVLVAACGIFGCSTWDLLPWPGIEPGPLALGAQSLSLWTAREVPKKIYLDFYKNLVLSEGVLFCLGSSSCSWHLSEMRRDRNKKKLQVSLVSLSIILPCFPDGLFSKLKVCGNPALSKSIGTICSAFAHFTSLCHRLVILKVVQAFFVIIIFVIVTCDLWCYYDSLKAQVMVSTFYQ